MSKFPPDVAELFSRGPPLPYRKPIDYPLEKRRTNPNITGLTKYLSSLHQYKEEFPRGTANKHLRVYEDVKHEKEKEMDKLQLLCEEWKPAEDPNIAGTDPYKTIFVGRLPYDTTELDLQEIFGKYGAVDKVRVVRDKSNKSRGYGFVLFADPQASKRTMRETGVHRGIPIKGRTCIVDFERGRTNRYFTPRRLGGGLGGRGYTQTPPRSSRFAPLRATGSDHLSGFGATRFTSDNGEFRTERYAPSSATAARGPSRYNTQPQPQPAPFEQQHSAGEEFVPTVLYKSRTARTRPTATDSEDPGMDY
ncbi:U1 snRNP complex subunit SNP1 KNAG_0L01580 [Huiozyma naganishii CBS 8797]|uniref:RRM domain-containing protein n=1 Tax=Huiozyma naganishii (strain ATCC MYA-139 / BCRC 22969 / CBS 8797 / KCTC 17520 / NBRC 10181 / NCYC 3082 / Yp74L-3) TaxID=1071383 RepID=J7RS94_HUIN7|nr:hypothetical protein KNAG_0L01580 [Kazachstania naganishii CBS 8797]CCK72778.1 hypothetical protein KNAG_0L01580 [Kazachstania naganishii CBS 8797]